MSRVTAPVSKISRALSAGPATIRAANPLLDSTTHTHHAGAAASLMPKYAELLREHSDSSRGLTTTHRPTPQPSISNRTKPLMQTFHSSASASSPALSSTNLDATVLPSLDFESTVISSGFRMPLLPDNYTAAHGPTTADSPVIKPSIVAADPDRVAPATPLSAVEGINMDGIELKFIHEQEAQPEEHSSMLKDLWKGMVDDVLGPAKKTA